MALAAAFLLTMILGSVVMAATLVAGIERRTAAAHQASAVLRPIADGGLVIAAAELRRRDWDLLLGGAGSDQWQRAVTPAVDLAALTARIRAETVSWSAHGADTPSWVLFAHVPWREVAGHSGRGDLIVWLADDWEERDGDPGRDTNGLLLVRAAAVDGVAVNWAEALCAREPDGRVRARHVRVW